MHMPCVLQHICSKNSFLFFLFGRAGLEFHHCLVKHHVSAPRSEVHQITLVCIRIQISSCFARQQCGAKRILPVGKIIEISWMGPQSCDLVVCFLQEILSISLSIRVQIPSSIDSRLLIKFQAVSRYIKTTSKMARMYLHFIQGGSGFRYANLHLIFRRTFPLAGMSMIRQIAQIFGFIEAQEFSK